PTIISFRPGSNRRPRTRRISSWTSKAAISTPRIGTFATVPVERLARLMMANSSAETAGPRGPVTMPGASRIIDTSSCASTLESSLSDAADVTIAVRSSPVPVIAARKPSAMERTETNTTITPTIPMIAITEAVNRCGILRRLTATTAHVCDAALNMRCPSSLSHQRLRDSQTASLPGWHASGDTPEQDDQAGADGDVFGAKMERGEQTSCRVATLDHKPRRQECQSA